jgi:hypothetical protein
MRAAATRRRKQAFLRKKRKLLGILPGFDSMDGENAKLMPLDNVYSYFMFVGPLERQHNPRVISKNVIFAWLLIVLNLFLQGTLLFAIFTTVVTGDVVWRNGIVSLSGDSVNPFAPASKCNAGGSLCLKNNGTFTCAPPSVQLAGRWDLLDLNSDGVWTREEVIMARKELQCTFAVDPLEVFNVFVSFLKKRADVIWLHPLVQSGEALHKAYFDFAKGDIIMCNYRNEEMCPNLLKRGFFDGPLKDGNSPRVGKTIDSALNYCYKLLKTGGLCERSLPSAYSVWRKSSEKQCLDPVYHKFDYTHPGTGMAKSLLEVDYMAVTDYEKGRRSHLFIVYKSIIIMTFVLCVVVELNDILVAFTWVLAFPSEHDVDNAVSITARSQQTESPTARSEISTGRSFRTAPDSQLTYRSHDPDPHKYEIHGISTEHRITVGCLTLIRLVLAVLLLWVGTVFLLQDTDYINLLLNGVGLVFIIEIANSLYVQLLSADLREKFENTEPLSVSMASVWKGLWIRKAALRDLCRLAFGIVLLCVCMYLHYIHIAKPLSTALECTCLNQGEQCFEAKEYNKDFWKTYWEYDVPQVFASVEQMQKKHAENDDQSVASIDKGLNDEQQQFAMLKVLPSDVEAFPVHTELEDGHLKSRHHGTGLLKHRHHRVIRLVSGRGQ